jgi:hypothetical protein
VVAWRHSRVCQLGLVALLLASRTPAKGAEAGADPSLRQLQQQNEALQRQLHQQQELINELSRKLSGLEKTVEQQKAASPSSSPSPSAKAILEEEAASRHAESFLPLKVRINGEGAVGYFDSQANGQFPNHEFRVDEAKLFVETPIWNDVYFFSEINLFTREISGATLQAGELYVDFENLSKLWKQDRQLNLRAGRFDIPFGEEYLTRDAIDNPLISHSIVDLWGVDEGVEAYGSIGKVSYVVALQNGGNNASHDFDSDKSVALRLGGDPAPWLHLSASAMRTGDLDAGNDQTSELWLGPGLVYSLGSPSTTRFHANLLEGDVHLKFARTTVKSAGGVLEYDDNDPVANNRRHVYYYSVEGLQKLYRGLYAAVRWSQFFAPDGFPVAGIGSADKFVWSGDLTKDLWLLSLGLGYRWSDHLVLKGEYSFQQGELLDGTPRRHENMFALNAAFAF